MDVFTAKVNRQDFRNRILKSLLNLLQHLVTDNARWLKEAKKWLCCDNTNGVNY